MTARCLRRRGFYEHTHSCFPSALVAVVWLLLLACDSPTEKQACADDPIAPTLKRTLFWGVVSPTQDEPNRGTPVSYVREPNWYAPDKILVRSARTNKGDLERGLFEVTIDPNTLAFVSVDALTFPYVIRNYDFDPATAQFAITFSVTSRDNQIVLARASGPTLAVIDTLLDSRWMPLRSRFVRSEGVIAYARHPSTMVTGFYYVSSKPGVEDSLVFAVDLILSDALGFDLQADKLVFTRTSGSGGDESSELIVIDIANGATPTFVATIPGSSVSVGVDPGATAAIVSLVPRVSNTSYPNYMAYVVNLSTGQSARVDVTTHPCGFVLADFASWSQTERRFAFSAGAFSGEGDRFPRELWIQTKVPSP